MLTEAEVKAMPLQALTHPCIPGDRGYLGIPRTIFMY